MSCGLREQGRRQSREQSRGSLQIDSELDPQPDSFGEQGRRQSREQTRRSPQLDPQLDPQPDPLGKQPEMGLDPAGHKTETRTEEESVDTTRRKKKSNNAKRRMKSNAKKREKEKAKKEGVTEKESPGSGGCDAGHRERAAKEPQPQPAKSGERGFFQFVLWFRSVPRCLSGPQRHER